MNIGLLHKIKDFSWETNLCASWVISTLILLGTVLPAEAQLNENCTASVLNRSVQVSPDGTFAIPNVPADQGFLRVRITCSEGGITLGGQSDFFVPIAFGATPVENIVLGVIEPIPSSIAISAPTIALNNTGDTTQLNVTGTLPDGSAVDLTQQSTGTTYTSSNSAIATVGPDGLVTAGSSSGTVVISAINEGVLASILLTVALSADDDGDGLPNDFEIANGLNPNDSTDAGQDPDGDGLTNIQEFNNGTQLFVADTDGDGLSDGEEIARGTNPTNPDNDLDGLLDGDEIAFGTNPLNPDSDGDGLPDGVEFALVGNPTGANPSADNDGDGLNNLDEVQLFTDPANPDTDGDGTPDGQELLRGCDPLSPELTTAVGRTVDDLGNPIQGAEVQVLAQSGQMALTNTLGFFSLTNIGACADGIRVIAEARVGGKKLTGFSELLAPIIGGTTELGDIVLTPVEGPLYPGPKFTVGTRPVSVAVADLNNDGVLDVATANRNSSNVAVLLGNGDGTFETRQLFEVGSGPTSIAAADLNGDGITDLVTANNFSPLFPGGDVSVLIGNGNGTFQGQQRFAAGFSPASLAIIDFNADGTIDLAVANSSGDDVSILLGNGNGTFQPEQRFSVGDDPQSIAAADLNGDGIPDLVFANRGVPDDVSILLGNGDGTFQTQQRFAVGVNPVSVTLADLNSDGAVDVVTANNFSNDVSVLLGNGDGTLQPEQRIAAGTVLTSVTVADLNGDNSADLITTSFNSNSIIIPGDVSVLFGNGDGTFQAPQRHAVGIRPSSAAVADLNTDGALDLAVVNEDSFFPGDVMVLLGNGDGTFQTQQRFSVDGSPRTAAVADLNSDGAPDLVVGNEILLGNGDGTFQASQNLATSTAAAVADLNGDGVFDLALTNGSVLLGNGDGTFQSPLQGSVAVIRIPSVAADLNADGNVDLVSVNQFTDDISVHLGNGDGTFQAEQLIAVGDNPRSVAVADLNLDGTLDLAVANLGFNNLSVLLGNGDGTFQTLGGFATGSNPISVAAADLNADGIIDLATANTLSRDVSILLGNGDGTFQPEQRTASCVQGLVPSCGNAFFVAVADINIDGTPDLVVANEDDNDVWILIGNGDGTFQIEQRFGVGDGPRSIVVADLNADGVPDIVTANSDSDDISILLHR